MKQGLVSVILPVFNRAAALREAVESVQAQTYRQTEVIVVDDGSTDGTGEECDRIALEKPELVRVIHQQNGGPGAARESGRTVAIGEFIQYLDSDDLLLPRKLERQIAALQRRPDAGIAYGYTRLRRRDGSLVEGPWKGSGEIRDTMLPSFLAERWWDTPNPLYRRTVTDAAGPWLPLWQEEDWEYDVRIGALGTRLVQVPDYVVEVRQLPEGGLAGTWVNNPVRMASRCTAHAEIYRHARRAGVSLEDPTMKRFARELFLVARQAGAIGLGKESRSLFEVAKEASGPRRAGNFGFRSYQAAANLLGWRTVGFLACVADRLRRHGPGREAA